MDKKQFCDDAAVKLRELDRFFQLQRDVSPGTAHKAEQVEQQRSHRDEARAHVETLRGRLTTVCADTAPLSDAVRNEIDREFAAIKKLLS